MTKDQIFQFSYIVISFLATIITLIRFKSFIENKLFRKGFIIEFINYILLSIFAQVQDDRKDLWSFLQMSILMSNLFLHNGLSKSKKKNQWALIYLMFIALRLCFLLIDQLKDIQFHKYIIICLSGIPILLLILRQILRTRQKKYRKSSYQRQFSQIQSTQQKKNRKIVFYGYYNYLIVVYISAQIVDYLEYKEVATILFLSLQLGFILMFVKDKNNNFTGINTSNVNVDMIDDKSQLTSSLIKQKSVAIDNYEQHNQMIKLRVLMAIKYLIQNQQDMVGINVKLNQQLDEDDYLTMEEIQENGSELIQDFIKKQDLKQYLTQLQKQKIQVRIYSSYFFMEQISSYQIRHEDLLNSFQFNQLFDKIVQKQVFNTLDNQFQICLINNNQKQQLINNYLKDYRSHLHNLKFSSFLTPLIGIYETNQNINFCLFSNMAFNEEGQILEYQFIITNSYIKKIDLTNGQEKYIDISQKNESMLLITNQNKKTIIQLIKEDFIFLNHIQAIDFKVVLCFYKQRNSQISGLQQKYLMNVQKKQTVSNMSDNLSEVNSVVQIESQALQIQENIPNKFQTFQLQYQCKVYQLIQDLNQRISQFF